MVKYLALFLLIALMLIPIGVKKHNKKVFITVLTVDKHFFSHEIDLENDDGCSFRH